MKAIIAALASAFLTAIITASAMENRAVPIEDTCIEVLEAKPFNKDDIGMALLWIKGTTYELHLKNEEFEVKLRMELAVNLKDIGNDCNGLFVLPGTSMRDLLMGPPKQEQ